MLHSLEYNVGAKTARNRTTSTIFGQARKQFDTDIGREVAIETARITMRTKHEVDFPIAFENCYYNIALSHFLLCIKLQFFYELLNDFVISLRLYS